MRKLSLIIIAFTLVLFTQCKKETITENTNPVGEDGGMVPITLELPVDNGAKTNFEDFLTNPLDPKGTIKWGPGTETVYLAVPNKIIYDDETGVELVNQPYAQMIPLTGTLQDEGTSIIFTGNVDKRILTDGYSYTLYYFGNTGGNKKEVFSQYFNRNIISSVSMSLDDQDGSRDNLGDYHFATLDIHVHAEFEPVQLPNGQQGQVAKSYDIHTNYPYFTTQVAIAYLDFTDLDETDPSGEGSLEGFYLYNNSNDNSVQMPNSVIVEFNNGSNTYNIDYFTGAESHDGFQYIKLSDNVKTKLVNDEPDPKSFIVLAPGVTTIKADGEGTYTFAGSGTVANRVYFTKNVSTNQILPLEWK